MLISLDEEQIIPLEIIKRVRPKNAKYGIFLQKLLIQYLSLAENIDE
jgi:hypothetical protein